MLEGFVITLREGVEAALVVCLLLGYLAKSGRPALRPAVTAGLAAAILASIAIAVAIRIAGIDPENETVEGILLTSSAVFVGGLVLWMHLHGKKLKAEIEQTAGAIAERPGAKLGLFLFTFLMVGREGVETVFFLFAAGLTTEGLLTSIGAIAGVAVAVALGVAFLKGSLRINLPKFFAVTTVVLLIFAVQLLAGGIHEFMEAGVIPSSQRVMAAVGPLVKHGVFFVIAVIAMPFVLMLTRATAGPAPEPANPAEARKERAMGRGERAGKFAFALLALLAVVSLGWSYAQSLRGLELSPAAAVAPADGVVRVAVGSLEEKKLHRYGLRSGDRTIRFLLWKNSDTDVRSAFDACEICTDWGYVQQGEHVICRNCTAEIVAATIGIEGGCNPIPLPSRIDSGHVVIEVAQIERRRDMFKPSEAPPSEMLQCPKCRMFFTPEDAGPEVEIGGRRVRVCRMAECSQ